MGNDPDGILILPSIQNFNPRSRVGNDRRCTVSQQQGIISIHVPAWGTTVGRYSTKAKAIFQSTFPRGERHSATIPMIVGMAFQSTFPRGERQSSAMAMMSAAPDFNPRSRVGNDGGYLVKSESDRAFQSTFPRGERR